MDNTPGSPQHGPGPDQRNAHHDPDMASTLTLLAPIKMKRPSLSASLPSAFTQPLNSAPRPPHTPAPTTAPCSPIAPAPHPGSPLSLRTGSLSKAWSLNSHRRAPKPPSSTDSRTSTESGNPLQLMHRSDFISRAARRNNWTHARVEMMSRLLGYPPPSCSPTCFPSPSPASPLSRTRSSCTQLENRAARRRQLQCFSTAAITTAAAVAARSGSGLVCGSGSSFSFGSNGSGCGFGGAGYGSIFSSGSGFGSGPGEEEGRGQQLAAETTRAAEEQPSAAPACTYHAHLDPEPGPPVRAPAADLPRAPAPGRHAPGRVAAPLRCGRSSSLARAPLPLTAGPGGAPRTSPLQRRMTADSESVVRMTESLLQAAGGRPPPPPLLPGSGSGSLRPARSSRTSNSYRRSPLSHPLSQKQAGKAGSPLPEQKEAPRLGERGNGHGRAHGPWDTAHLPRLDPPSPSAAATAAAAAALQPQLSERGQRQLQRGFHSSAGRLPSGLRAAAAAAAADPPRGERCSTGSFWPPARPLASASSSQLQLQPLLLSAGLPRDLSSLLVAPLPTPLPASIRTSLSVGRACPPAWACHHSALFSESDEDAAEEGEEDGGDMPVAARRVHRGSSPLSSSTRSSPTSELLDPKQQTRVRGGECRWVHDSGSSRLLAVQLPGSFLDSDDKEAAGKVQGGGALPPPPQAAAVPERQQCRRYSAELHVRDSAQRLRGCSSGRYSEDAALGAPGAGAGAAPVPCRGLFWQQQQQRVQPSAVDASSCCRNSSSGGDGVDVAARTGNGGPAAAAAAAKPGQPNGLKRWLACFGL